MFCILQPLYPFPDAALTFPASNGMGSSNVGTDTLSSEAAAAVAAVVGLRQQQMRNHSDELANFTLPTQLHSNKGGLADAIPLPKLGSPATSSQLCNSVDMGFPMPRLASPAISNIHGLSGLSTLHLMQNFNDAVSSSGSSRRSGTATPTHTETKSNAEPRKLVNPSKNIANGNDHGKISETNNNNRCSSNSDRSDTIQDLSVNSPNEKYLRFGGDDFDSVELALNGLPFKPSLREFLSPSPTTTQPMFADDLSDFEHPNNDTNPDRTSNSMDLFKSTRDKVKMEPMSESRN